LLYPTAERQGGRRVRAQIPKADVSGRWRVQQHTFPPVGGRKTQCQAFSGQELSCWRRGKRSLIRPPVGIRIRGAGAPPVNRRGFLRAGTPTGAYRRGRPQPLDREVAQLVGVAFASSREFNDLRRDCSVQVVLADNAKLGT